MESTKKKNNFFNSLVSVIMPVHNGERFLREAIESVLNQTYTNFEFLIIENCSTDSSIEIIKSYNDHRIRLIIEENCGQVQAYNRGFKEAKGEYVFIHDQDDISHIERFEKQIEYIIKNKVDICGSFVSIININGCIIDLQSKGEKDEEIKREFFYNASAMHNSTVLIKRDTLIKLKFWDSNYFPIADSEFYYRALLTNVKFGNVPEYLYYYRIHKSQITANPTKHGRTLLANLQLNYLLHNRNMIILKDYYFFKSLIFYYTDYLLYSLLYNFISMLYGKFDRNNMRYFIILIFFGFPLKIFRKYNLFHSSIFLKTKTYLDKIFESI